MKNQQNSKLSNEDIQYLYDWLSDWQWQRDRASLDNNIAIVGMFARKGWLYSGRAYRGERIPINKSKPKIGEKIVIHFDTSMSGSKKVANQFSVVGYGDYIPEFYSVIIRAQVKNALKLGDAVEFIRSKPKYRELYDTDVAFFDEEKEVIIINPVDGVVIKSKKMKDTDIY